jgi:6-phosphogluconolactonase/glucosamine-6-phosphate isomerase/deaminase
MHKRCTTLLDIIYLNFTLSITERKLSEAPYNKTLDWNNWYIFWSDERAVAKNHVQSNYKLTKEGFLSKVCELKKPFFCFCFHIVV